MVVCRYGPVGTMFAEDRQEPLSLGRIVPYYLVGLRYGDDLLWFRDVDESGSESDPGMSDPQNNLCDDTADNGATSVDTFGAEPTGAVTSGRWRGATLTDATVRTPEPDPLADHGLLTCQDYTPQVAPESTRVVRDRLVPATVDPQESVLCRYTFSTDDYGKPPAVRRVPIDNPAAVAETLTWLPPGGDPHGSCADDGVGRRWWCVQRHLDQGRRRRGECGRLRDGGRGHRDVAHAGEDPVTGGYDSCSEDGARFGQQTMLVPTGAVAVRWCDRGRAPGPPVTTGVDTLVGALDSGPATRKPMPGDPQYPPEQSGTRSGYHLLFLYPTGPPARVFVSADADRVVDNDILEGTASATVLPMIEAMFPDS